MVSNVNVGAIRWDAYYANTQFTPPWYVADRLSQSQYQSRAPIHATLTSPRRLVWAPTQATMDAEIVAARNGGLAYWAFLRYAPADAMSAGLALYQSSSIKAQMPWCSMTQPFLFGGTGAYSSQVAAMVAEFQQAHYFKVLGNRPLLYIYVPDNLPTFGGSAANFKAALDSLRAATQAAGLGNPYIVVATNISTTLTNYTATGADAIFDYVTRTPEALDAAYTALDASAQAYWAAMSALGVPTVPTAMVGWDRRPRIERPVPWEVSYQRPHFGMRSYVVAATSAELTAHFQAIVNYVIANPAACPSGTALAYAWNEHDEGGWLGPTIGDPTASKLSAIASSIANR